MGLQLLYVALGDEDRIAIYERGPAGALTLRGHAACAGGPMWLCAKCLEGIDDLDANVDYELERYANNSGNRVRFQREARERYLRFALAPDALWLGNFRDLNASITRLCTLADAGSIKTPDVDVEVERLRADWRPAGDAPTTNTARLSDFLSEEQIAALDLFDKLQREVILPVCQRARTMSDAGRTLFAVSREQKASKNDADRLRKYLLRFGLSWQDVRGG